VQPIVVIGSHVLTLAPPPSPVPRRRCRSPRAGRSRSPARHVATWGQAGVRGRRPRALPSARPGAPRALVEAETLRGPLWSALGACRHLSAAAAAPIQRCRALDRPAASSAGAAATTVPPRPRYVARCRGRRTEIRRR
jgi:hypothetical protein